MGVRRRANPSPEGYVKEDYTSSNHLRPRAGGLSRPCGQCRAGAVMAQDAFSELDALVEQEEQRAEILASLEVEETLALDVCERLPTCGFPPTPLPRPASSWPRRVKPLNQAFNQPVLKPTSPIDP